MPRKARLFERPATLDGGPDGLALHRRIAIEAVARLEPGGWLVIETGEAQLPAGVELMRHVGLDARSVSDDGRDAHVVLGQRPA